MDLLSGELIPFEMLDVFSMVSISGYKDEDVSKNDNALMMQCMILARYVLFFAEKFIAHLDESSYNESI